MKEPIKSIRRSYVRFFGTNVKKGDVMIFDQRGAIRIPKGQKSIADDANGGTAGEADSMVIPRPTGGKNVSAQKAMDAHFGWVYACTKAISDEMANIDWRLYKINAKGEKEELMDHELLDLLDGVNERQTGPEFKKMLSAHLELTGNAYVFLLGVKTFDDKPKAMYLLNPGQVKIFIDKTTFPYQISRYEFTDDGRKFKFQPYEIIHLKYPDPNDPTAGLGTVQGIAEWIDNDNYAMEFNRKFFQNGARMSGVFETDMNSVEQTQRLKVAFEEQFQGVRNAYKSMIMPKGVKWVPTQVNAKDMDFNALLDTTAERILAGFRVSKTILGTAESDTNRATAETADYVFAKRTIKPKMEMIVSYLNEFLAPRFEEDIYISFNDPVPEDRSALSAEMAAVMGGKQILTQNEARQEYFGLPPVESSDADSISPAASAAPFSMLSAKKSADTFVRISKVKGKRGSAKFKTQFSRNKSRRKEMAATLAEKMAAFVLGAKSKNLAEMSDEEYLAVIYAHTKSRLDEYEPKIIDAIRALNADQEKEVKKNLSSAIKSYPLRTRKDITPSKLFDLDAWIALTVDALSPIFFEFFGKESAAAARNIGNPEIDLMKNPAIKRALDARMALLARSYNETAVEALKTKLNQGLADGLSQYELADKVSEVYEWSNTVRAQMVAKTETVAVSNMANKETWKEAGTVKTVRWYTSQKDNVCPFCTAMSGKVIDIDEDFFKKGATIDGEDGTTMTADYSDIGGPPLHVNCGCFIRPDSFAPIEGSKSAEDRKADEDSEVAEALKQLKEIDNEE